MVYNTQSLATTLAIGLMIGGCAPADHSRPADSSGAQSQATSVGAGPTTQAHREAIADYLMYGEGRTDNFSKAVRALKLVQSRQFAPAREALLSLTQRDFARKPRKELSSKHTYEIVPQPDIGDRDLLLARCQAELGEPEAAEALLWKRLERGNTPQEAFLLLVELSENQKIPAALGRIDAELKDHPDNDAFLLARKYLTIAGALPDGDVHAAVQLIRTGPWLRSTESGPEGEFKEWACQQLANHPDKTVQVLIEALEVNDQPTWIIYCLGRTSSPRALTPLEKARARIKNTYALHEIDEALARIRAAQPTQAMPTTREGANAGE